MDEATKEAKGTRTTDPELGTMARVDRLLSALAPEAARRVLGWLAAKYAERTPVSGLPPASDPAYRLGIKE